MPAKPPNAAVIELARIFLEFEIEQRTAAAGLTRQDESPAATAETTQATPAQQEDFTSPRPPKQKKSIRVEKKRAVSSEKSRSDS